MSNYTLTDRQTEHSERHAYLIIANRNPDQLQKLINVLDDCRNDIYLLIDRKAVDDGFSMHFSTSYSSLFLIEPIKIYWGDYSQIDAEIRLFKAACTHSTYAYYHLLSGLDLPLANQDVIHNFFDQNPGREFITYSAAGSIDDLKFRVQKHLFPHEFRDDKNVLAKASRVLEHKLFKHYSNRIVDMSIIGYGSNWVSIDDSFCRQIVDHEEQIKKMFWRGFLVDELFIPTLLNLYPDYKDKVYWDKPVHDIPNEFQGNLRYINWWDGKPYTWRLSDYDKLRKARDMGHLFSRKFDEKVDEDIINKVVSDIINS